MALLVGFIVAGLLLFMVAELVFGPGLAVLLVGLCGLGLGGGPGFAGGIVGGLLGLVGSALVRGLIDGLSPDGSGASSQAPPGPRWHPPPQPWQGQSHAPTPASWQASASTVPAPPSGAVTNPASWQNAPTPIAPRSIPAERPSVGLPGVPHAPASYDLLTRAALGRAAPSWRDGGQSASPAPTTRACELPTRVALVRVAPSSGSSARPTPVEVRKKGRAP